MTQLLAQINPGDISLAGFVPCEGRNIAPVNQPVLIYSRPEGVLLEEIACEVKTIVDSSMEAVTLPAQTLPARTLPG